jgi:hypothetical protein
MGQGGGFRWWMSKFALLKEIKDLQHTYRITKCAEEGRNVSEHTCHPASESMLVDCFSSSGQVFPRDQLIWHHSHEAS